LEHVEHVDVVIYVAGLLIKVILLLELIVHR